MFRKVGLLGVSALAGLSAAIAAPMTAHSNRLTLSPSAELADLSGTAIAVSPDGKRWAVADGSRLHVGRGHALVASVPATNDVPVGPLRYTQDGLRWGATNIALDPAGTPHEIPAASVAVHDALSRSLPSAQQIEIASTTLAADGTAIVAGTSRPSIRRGARPEPPAGRLLAIDPAHHARVLWQGDRLDAPSLLAIEGSFVAAAGIHLMVVELPTGKVLLDEARPHAAGTVTALAFARQGDAVTLYSAGADGTLVTWDLPSGRRHASIRISDAPLRALAVAAARGLIAVTGWDDQLRVYSLADLAQPVATLALGAHGEALAFSPSGDQLLVALGGARGALRFLALSSAR